MAIKGDVFDVSKNTSSYGPGAGYSVFTGKDSSKVKYVEETHKIAEGLLFLFKALGKSSLKPEECIADYSDLTEKELETLEQWHAFFSKRYNIVGKVVPDN